MINRETCSKMQEEKDDAALENAVRASVLISKRFNYDYE